MPPASIPSLSSGQIRVGTLLVEPIEKARFRPVSIDFWLFIKPGEVLHQKTEAWRVDGCHIRVDMQAAVTIGQKAEPEGRGLPCGEVKLAAGPLLPFEVQVPLAFSPVDAAQVFELIGKAFLYFSNKLLTVGGDAHAQHIMGLIELPDSFAEPLRVNRPTIEFHVKMSGDVS